ncbi:MAG: phosphoribosylformylglycinamidine synthase, partial [Clostridiaceae bacterium]
IKEGYKNYLDIRKFVYEDKNKPLNLMDMAVIGMKSLRKKGKLDDLDISDEINACSIVVPVDIDGEMVDYLIMFKNETHNHPTEIEPFGGAATCLGGAIRDPLSGRSYVYQAMRITGSGDPRTKIEDTLDGKLPQRKITLGAASGYSSYGNQIGLATGQVSEIYDEGFLAKRMELGAVIGAAPKENVIRETPLKGDLIILVGGRTGRDGCGGATGSSKEHNEDSILTCGAEVQKGNAPTERKIQRLFRNKDVSLLIKRCNDFGAGGVCVAIGELADGLDINLDNVSKKYEGLDGTELAISESQERMAVVVDKDDADKFIALSEKENLEAKIVAEVKEEKRLRMFLNGRAIVDVKRSFLDTNGVTQYADVLVKEPTIDNYFERKVEDKEIKELFLDNIGKLNICSEKGLVERFDSTIGAGTILLPYGGKYQASEEEGMAAKVPVLKGETKTATLMTYGYNPKISRWSPYYGAAYSVVEAISKIVAIGGDYKKVRLTFQEYFERMNSRESWGKPFQALLGALYAQEMFETAAIGGKDSMSGTFKDINVPPTLVAIAVCASNSENVVSKAFKKTNSKIVYIPHTRKQDEMPDFELLKRNYEKINSIIKKGYVLSSSTVKHGGIAEAISKMSFGNKIGFKFTNNISKENLFASSYGSFVLEIKQDAKLDEILKGIEYSVLGETQAEPIININGVEIEIDKVYEKYEKPLEKVFRTKTKTKYETPIENLYEEPNKKHSILNISKPKVFIPVFPGTNCEYDSKKAFERAGGETDVMVFRNLKPTDVHDSIEEMVKRIENSQIIMLPGGFSAGDEPEGSGKFIAAVFRNEMVKQAVLDLLYKRDGLMIGICNGFQALVKLGLVPYGDIRDMKKDSPTLTFNDIGRHSSRMVTTKIVSNKSPWFNNVKLGDKHTIAISHGEGKFTAPKYVVDELMKNGQIATQYIDFQGNPSMDIDFNPNGSINAIEGITSLDGRILGKMGHSERMGDCVAINVPGEKDQKIFKAGIEYFL